MLNLENCRTLMKTYDGKPKDIIIGQSLVTIDYTYDAKYWIDRLEMVQTFTATDTAGRGYEVYENKARNLITAVPTTEKKGA